MLVWILAQTPGMDEAIQAAVQGGHGWEAIVLIVLILTGFTGGGVMVRQYSLQALEREERLSARITHLEDLIREKLFDVVGHNGMLMEKMLEQSERLGLACDKIVDTMHTFDVILQNRPCMAMDAAARAQLVEALAKAKRSE
jgi:hypothetical protein